MYKPKKDIVSPAFRRALSEAARYVESRWTKPARNFHLDSALSVANLAVLRASQDYLPIGGPFEPFAASYVRLALQGFASDLHEQKQRRPATRSLNEVRPPAAEEHPDSLPSELIDGLTKNQQEIIRHKIEGNRSFSEIAKLKGISKAAVHRSYHRGIRQLRKREGIDK